MIVIPQSNNLPAKGVLGVSGFVPSISSSSSPEASICKKDANFTRNEPVSVLDTRSPSPSASSSSCSYGAQHGGNTAVPGVGSGKTDGRKEELVTELEPFTVGLEPEKSVLGFGDLDNLLPEFAGSDQSFLRWISGDVEDPSVSLKQLLNGDLGCGVSLQSSGFEVSATGSLAHSDNVSFSGSNICLNANIEKLSSVIDSINSRNNNFENPNVNPSLEQKPQPFGPQVMANQTQFQNAACVNIFGSSSYDINQEQPPPKRHNSGTLGGALLPKVPFFDANCDFMLRKQPLGQMQPQVNLLPPHQFQPKPLIVPKLEAAGGGGNGNLMVPRHQLQEQQFIYDQIFQASELLLAGQFSNAQMILARLNQQLSPIGKPSRRAAFYIKEALQLPFLLPCTSTFLPPRSPTPFDCVLKMDAYKAFSEISPLIQFMNFTSNQAILEALGDAEQIHIIDFDIGFGAQWSSFMQELPSSNRKATSLKITAFASPSTHHSIEIGIMHESLTQFANDAGIRFELEVINLDSFDPKSYPLSTLRSSECEAIAINFPIWSISSCPFAFPSLLHCMKQLSPKVVVSLERGCERTELPLKHHLIHALQYYETLLASIDAANITPDIGKKIERSLFQPSIENMILGRLRSSDRMPPWRNLFASAGFSPVAFSNMTEIQAECVVKRTQVGGFHVQKRQTSLVLCWKQQELLSAVTWRC
ncbi:GRAS transcriptional regulator HAM [Solanum lycopersicum]|uniref:GRAS transcriptional regulator HAM n=2 Tax=Solanum lycopersicum TaxID=4081 RepID=A0A3Q7IP28_SOLLC|nr:GRAS transcriptional regulator HAM [Solanum lycopersicum]XP_025888052.1 GRAS transcriptional regulator HAM isoform X1 [Solanum lycopersicum]